MNTHPETLNELALFAGAGGGLLGGKLLGWRTVCAVEWDAYARDVLVARQNDGCLEAFPIWDDVQTFDGRPWRGIVDVVSGGFPCQDISAAGKGAGIDGERSGMWRHMARIVGEVRPRFVFVENSPMLVSRGLGRVLADLAALGYDARWGIVGAHHARAPHKRDRIWIVAHAGCAGDESERGPGEAHGTAGATEGEAQQWERCWIDAGGSGQDVADAVRKRRPTGFANQACWEKGNAGIFNNSGADMGHAPSQRFPHGTAEPMGEPGENAEPERSDWWATEPDVGRVAHGVAARVDRLRCLGNGQVPAVVRLAWRILSKSNT